MTRQRAGATPIEAKGGDRVGGAMRQAGAMLRTVRWSRLGWTTVIGAVGGLLFVVSHGMRTVPALLEHRASIANTLLECAIAVTGSVVVAILLLVGVTAAERGDGGRPRGWARYTIATLVAIACATAIVHWLAPRLPVAALGGWYGLGPGAPIDTFVFTNWLLFGGLAVMVYVRLRRARWIQAAFERAELERATASGRLVRSRLATTQAQVEPGFLFETLHQIELRYEHDAARGERLVDDLIAYLRSALPQIRGEDSTLAREAALAEAYLRIAQDRIGSRLEFAVDIPPALGMQRFPPMLLLPLIETSVRRRQQPSAQAGMLAIQATSHADRMRVTVTDTGARDIASAQDRGTAALHARLAELSRGDATLSFMADHARGATAIIDLPLT